jgi:hypothetical protein
VALISPTGFGSRSRDGLVSRGLSEVAHRMLQTDFIGKSTFDLLVTRPSIRYFHGKSFRGDVDEGLCEYAFATTHQPGAWHAPMVFLSGKLFTPNVRRQVYGPARVPVLVLYDKDPYTSFGALKSFVRGHDNWTATRVRPSRGLPHFEQPHKTVAALDSFWFKTVDRQIVADELRREPAEAGRIRLND